MSLRFLIKDTPVEVDSRSRSFMDYSNRFLADFPTAPPGREPDLRVVFLPVDKSYRRIALTKQWGTDVQEVGSKLRFRAHSAARVDCLISPSSRPGTETICCRSAASVSYWIRRLIRGRHTSDNQLFMTMLRQGLLLPALARLLVQNGILTLHASAVARDGRAVILTGLNGCGKSGLALHLVVRHNFRYLADNFAVVDPSKVAVFSFPEPIRVDQSEHALARRCFSGGDQAFGKLQLTPAPEVLDSQATVACIARVLIGERFTVRQVSPDRFCRGLEALHRFLGETPEYSWLQLYYEMQHDMILGDLAEAARKQLCLAVPCYEVEIPRNSKFEARYHEVTAWINESLRA